MDTIFLLGFLILQLSVITADNNEKECGPFPDVVNASPVQAEPPFILGSVVTYSCNFGYLSFGKGDSAVCKINDSTDELDWTLPSIHCRPRSCGDPGSLSNGQRVGSLFTFPNSVEYICNVGYWLIGLPRLYCSGSGTWTGKLPKCKIINCPAPPNIDKGQTLFSSTTYGSEVTFKCDKGYGLHGVDRITCTESGAWSDDIPSCAEILCDVPEPPLGATMSISSGKVIAGMSIVFSCDPGLVLKGSSVLKCMQNGQWNFDLPICSRPCTSKDIPNGQLGTLTLRARAKKFFQEAAKGVFYTDEQELILRCNRDYEPLGLRKSEATVKCVNGEWKPHPVCEPASCRSPGSVQNGGVSFKSMKHGAIATFHCNHGYYLASGGVKKCQFGYWIGPFPLCVSGTCRSDPPSIEHGRASQPYNRDHGEYATYTCDRGFNLSKNSSVMCYQGIWQGEPPLCYPGNCINKPPAVHHGKASYSSNVHGSVVKYVCDRGYRLMTLYQNAAVVCRHGEWDGSPPSCLIEGYNCFNKPPQIENGRAESHSQNHGSVVTYICDEGYILDQNVSVVCNFSRWYGKPPSCIQDYDCRKPPPEIEHGKATFESQSHGAVVNYTCEEGYILFQKSPVLCKYGNWNGTAPYCFPDYNCKSKPPSIANGKAIFQSLNHGSIVSYTCESGYSIDRNRSIMCYYGNWTGTLPSCVEVGIPSFQVALSANISEIAPSTSNPSDELTDSTNAPSLFEDITEEEIAEEALNNSSSKTTPEVPDLEIEKKENVSPSVMPKPLEKKDCVFHFEDRHIQVYDGEKWLDDDGVVPHGNVLRFHCRDFTYYKLVGPSKVTCIDGAWKPLQMPYCLQVSTDDLLIVPRPVESVVIGPGGILHIKPGNFFEIECLSFYNPAMPRPYWTTSSKLHPNLIHLPERPTSAILRIESATSGYSGNYKCHSRSGDGSSRGVDLKVLDVECSEFLTESPLSVTYDPDRKQYGMARFTCDEPWTLSGARTLQCLPDGSWTRESPSCFLNTCSLSELAEKLPEEVIPDIDEDATENVTAGSQIHLQCYSLNHWLEGTKSVKCLQEGHWQAFTVACLQGCVSYWQQSDNSSVVVSAAKEFYRFGEQVTFSCSNNKTLTTNIERIICLGNGWSDHPLPGCKDNLLVI